MNERLGKGGRRTKTGCLTCRKRHYKCDEAYPCCTRCAKANLLCEWSSRTLQQSQYVAQSASRDETQERALAILTPMSTREYDEFVFYFSKFHQYSYQISAWTGLIALPRRSHIPSILQTEQKNAKKMTNWATFYLPHLASVSTVDPLSLIMAGFTALRMKAQVIAAAYYAKVLTLLRAILSHRQAVSMNNQDFLRIWSTTLLMAEYEALLGNQQSQSQHVDGATTLSFIAANRFEMMPHTAEQTEASQPQQPMPDNRQPVDTGDSVDAQAPQQTVDNAETVTAPVSPFESVPRNERELPAYLMALTQRLRHSSTICQSLDTHWPTFTQPPLEQQALGGLLQMSAECYAHVMPLVEEFYTRMSLVPPTSAESYMTFMAHFQPRVVAARESIAQYQAMLHRVTESENTVYNSCAEAGFPFSPVIHFVNPQLAQPTVIPYVFLMFLAPFISDAEHSEAIRFISGVYAAFDSVPGLKMDAAFPDLYVASFWKRGTERDYFQLEKRIRSRDFMYVIVRIWGTIDYLEMAESRSVNKTEVLGIALKEYRAAQAQGLHLQHTRH